MAAVCVGGWMDGIYPPLPPSLQAHLMASPPAFDNPTQLTKETRETGLGANTQILRV